MPNHVENIITLKGDEKKIREMLEAIKNDDFGLGTLDFNKIIPMPNSLNIEAGSRTDRGLKAYSDFIDVYVFGRNAEDALNAIRNISKESEDAFLKQRTDVEIDEWELGKTAWNNIQNYGAPTWYEWSINNWSTKWNAYGYDESADYSQNTDLWFQTAWSAPHPILQKLTEMYPDITFEHEWRMKISVQIADGKFTETANAPRNIIPKTKKKPLNLPAVSGTTILPSLI